MRYLKEECSVVRIKGGTEVEDLTFKEILFLRKITKNTFPLTVKIGGPEARNDIRFLLENGIDTVLGPMIESEYGLKNYISSVKDLETYYNKKIEKAINVETITTYGNLNKIYNSIYFDDVMSVTVGRSDLSGSMGKSVDDPEVIKITKDIIDRAKKLNKKTSVGGKIRTDNIDLVTKQIGPDLINTRHIVFDLSQGKELKKPLIESLLFEIDLYQAFKKICPIKKEIYEYRIQDTLKRAGM